MHLIDNGTQGPTTPPTPQAAVGTPGYANSGPPGTFAPTVFDPDIGNTLIAELANVILSSGQTFNRTSYTQLLAALTLNFSSLAGQSLGLVGSSVGGASASWTAKELIAETALGDVPFKGSSLSLSFNGATTGAGGMDTGGLPTSADLSIYAIYNPATSTWNTLGCLGTTSNGPIYAGANMPAGYTASALIFAGTTDSSATIRPFQQFGRSVFLRAIQWLSGTVSNTSPVAGTPTSIPNAALTVSGNIGVNLAAGGQTFYLAGDTNGTGQQQNGTSTETNSNNGNFSDVPLITPGTIYYHVSGGSPTITVNFTKYTF